MKKKSPHYLQSCFEFFETKFVRNTILLVSFFMLFLSGFAKGTGNKNVFTSDDVVLDCNNTSTHLSTSYLRTCETNTYSVTSIPFEPPFPFTGGTPVSVNIDDRWSNAITLPFELCFYGQAYTQMVIGSNAVVSFNLVQNAPNSYCEWSFDGSIPDPNLFPTAIFSPYMDTNPAESGSGQINWTVAGTAPKRAMVVSFPDIPYFSCTSQKLTSQIVIYETTNVIEIYIKNRFGGCTWNEGNAVVGIQNQDGTLGEFAPGRNKGNWAATHEAWRYTPNGNSKEDFDLLDANGNVIRTEFDYDKHNIKPQAAFELDKLVALMKRNPEMVIKVGAHTDSRGSDTYNLALSDRRAQSTVQYVLSKGIAKERISGEGFGENNPAVKCGDNCTEEQYQKNRRSEFKIIKR